ncbi:hypothetical protein A3D72_01605 [Candidatus Uhrbacteria bacterium RIFCSPHIGHO2_02_FULL_57_19]|uniref:Uncharacterized protein n=1 Tax=Candidatus Uhrbacteria bacterium RIFCSPHIGHO2_02_FULL_57_19 TaxID=1802391 RepID=A0A1F7U4I8_9BACT|nr:MAG: hypothetical protein A3D72_01605 [Candidatus Uhrbacteria bacterium RIFCSPHIGHO2_02_FULL_57_19]
MTRVKPLSRNALVVTAMLVLLILSSAAWNIFVQLREVETLPSASLIAWVIFLFAVPLILIAIVQRELAVGYWLSFFYGIIFIYLTLGTLLVPKPSECCLTEAKTIASAGGVLALVLIAFAFRGAREKRRRR